MGIEFLPDGLRICRLILLDEWKRNPDGLLAAEAALGHNIKDLISNLIMAAAQNPEAVLSPDGGLCGHLNFLDTGNLKQEWEDIESFADPTLARCHLCKNNKNVKQGNVPLTICTGHGEEQANKGTWSLCLECHEKGWLVPFASLSALVYLNPKTNETKIY